MFASNSLETCYLPAPGAVSETLETAASFLSGQTLGERRGKETTREKAYIEFGLHSTY